MNQIFQRPIDMLRQRIRVQGGVIDIYAIAWDGYERRVVALLFGGRKTHVKAAWANIMGGKKDISFALIGHGYVTLSKVQGKGLYKSTDFLMPCGATARFMYLRQMTIEGIRILQSEKEFYYLVTDGNIDLEVVRFARYLQSATLLSLKPNAETGRGIDLRWAHDLVDLGKSRKLIRQLESEGLTVWAVSRDGEEWRKGVSWGIKRGMFPLDGGGF